MQQQAAQCVFATTLSAFFSSSFFQVDHLVVLLTAIDQSITSIEYTMQ